MKEGGVLKGVFEILGLGNGRKVVMSKEIRKQVRGWGEGDSSYILERVYFVLGIFEMFYLN